MILVLTLKNETIGSYGIIYNKLHYLLNVIILYIPSLYKTMGYNTVKIIAYNTLWWN